MRLKDKVAIVTGSGGGIGRHIAIEFVREGAKVVVLDIKSEGVEETLKIIESEFGEGFVIGFQSDIGKESGVARIVGACVERFHRVDCIVNNAADQTHTQLENWNLEDWNRITAVNVGAVALFAKIGLPYLLQNTGSSIVNISSIRADLSMEGGTYYDASKAAMLGMTRTLAVELGLQGIRVNAICPGNIMSFGEEDWKSRQDELHQALHKMPYALGRVGKPEEVAKTAVFLASEDASFITGQAIYVDGGITIMNPETAMWRTYAMLQGTVRSKK